MIFKETKLKGAFEIEINKIKDDRGFFGRSWCKNEMAEYNLNTDIAQANTSLSKLKGTLRGIHYQVDPYQETKLVRCVKGSIYDVIIDLRANSPTYLQWMGIELSENEFNMLYVPENFAHGYLTLTDDTVVSYLVTQFYTPGAEHGIRWNDPLFDIKWPIEITNISQKDANLSNYKPIR